MAMDVKCAHLNIRITSPVGISTGLMQKYISGCWIKLSYEFVCLFFFTNVALKT